MSSLGIFDKETKTYKKVADLSKPAVIDSSMSDASTNAVQNKVVKSYIDNGVNSSKKLQTYRISSTTETYGDDYPIYAQWRDTTHVQMKCDNYTVEIDYATSAGSANNSNTVNGHTVNSDVPSGAKFTDTVYDDTGIQNEINTLKKSVSDGKTTVANAITAKGVTTATDATFATMAGNISKITTGVDTSDATATAAQILTGKTAYVKGSKVTGTLGTKTDITRTNPNALSTARQNLAGASVGNYALFAGGYNSGTVSTVDAYNSSLTRITAPALSPARRNLAGASVGNYALFAGGTAGSTDSTVDAYNSSLTRSTPPALSTARSYLAGASVGNYALFAGGSNSGYKSEVDAYNSSLARITAPALRNARSYLAGASVGNYALFAGGDKSGYKSEVDAYNSSLARITAPALSTARSYLAGASVGNYALFAGGYTTGSIESEVDAYNSSLTRITAPALSPARRNLAGASVGNYALFAGGTTGSTYVSTVDAYNSSLTRSIPPALSTARQNLAGASVGNYALFAGGSNSSTVSTVDAYERPHISIPAQKIYL